MLVIWCRNALEIKHCANSLNAVISQLPARRREGAAASLSWDGGCLLLPYLAGQTETGLSGSLALLHFAWVLSFFCL